MPRIHLNVAPPPTGRQQQLFWARFDVGKGRRTPIREKQRGRWLNPGYRSLVEPVFVTPRWGAVVRWCRDAHSLENHVKMVDTINAIGQKGIFRFFHFVPTSILAVDKAHLRLAEGLHWGPNLNQLISNEAAENPYARPFLRRIARKNVSPQTVASHSHNILGEVRERFGKTGFDCRESNLIIVDFDPLQKKPFIALIDHEINAKTKKSAR